MSPNICTQIANKYCTYGTDAVYVDETQYNDRSANKEIQLPMVFMMKIIE